MILQALTAYYEALAAKGEISRPGWGGVRVQYALELDDEGRPRAVLPLESLNEKGKPIRRMLNMPAPVKRTVGILSNFLWDSAAYLLGIDSKGNPERAAKCFAAARELHLELLDGADDPFARAICAFFNGWRPENADGDPLFADCMDSLTAGANLTFMYHGELPGASSALAKCWQRHYDGTEKAGGVKMRCLVTGERASAEKIHPAIKRVHGAPSMGATLVAFNAPAFCSYGREQNLNAPMSKHAAFAYTTALNHLLADAGHTRLIGDTTVVYWAETAEEQYQDVFGCFADGSSVKDTDLKTVLAALAQGRSVEWSGRLVEPDNRFYVLGIAPNSARLSVRFFLQSTFRTLAENMSLHYEQLEIVRPEYDRDVDLPLWKLLRETVNQNARDKSASPQMAGDTLRAILTGGRYPATLYQQTMLRVKAEHEVTRGKAAIIKAYLLRNTGDQFNKEALTVELNEKTSYQPYVLGRLFSVLESIQQKANPGINTTIKDKYFTSACATPAVVFPTLLNLAGKHLRKLDTGSEIYFSKQLQELVGMLTQSFPAHLSLPDQGVFQIGYYHQTQKRFEKKNAEISEEDKENV